MGEFQDNRNFVDVIVNKSHKVHALYDPGATVTLIDEAEFRKIPVDRRPSQDARAPRLILENADKRAMSVRGCYILSLSLLDRTIPHTVYVIRNLSSPMFLGADFIKQHGLSHNLREDRLEFLDCWSSAAATLSHKVTLPANSSRKVPLKSYSYPFSSGSSEIKGPINTVCAVDCTTSPIFGKDQIVSIDRKGHASLLIDNPLDIPVTLEAGTYLGSLERVNLAECASITFNMDTEPLSASPPGEGSTPITSSKRNLLVSAMREQTTHLSQSLRIEYLNLILRNHDVFSDDKYDLGRTNVMEHTVHLKDSAPVYVKQFRLPEAHRSVLLQHLQNWIKLGVVSPSKSHYNSPIFCVPKKDGGLRPVLDFRAINEKTFVDKYSQNEIEDCIDAIGRAKSKLFSSLDLTCGFWQLPLNEKSREYTSFTIPGVGSFQWNCTPMGLLGSPASFGRLMDFVMRKLPSAITYQDDVLIHSSSHEDHFLHLQTAFNRIRAHGLKLNVSKCRFGQNEIAYLGFLLTPTGILPGVDKTKAIREFDPPTSIRQVREFIGLCNYFRNSIKDFAKYSQYLTVLTRKDCPWEGGPLPREALEAFSALKNALLTAPVLAYPDPSRPYHLLVDAAVGSEDRPGGMGASLVQFDDDGNPHPIGYVSRGLTSFERNYTAYLLELAACVYGIEKFHVYLSGKRFTLHTDHKPLEPLKNVHKRTLNRLQQLMLEYDFDIAYKPGCENTVPDFLSRNPVSAVDVKYDVLVELQDADELISKLKQDIRANSDSPKFQKLREKLLLENNILFHLAKDGRAQIFAPESLRAEILQSAHNSLGAGHMGQYKTAQRILGRYFWPSMQSDVDAHIRDCVTCRRTKSHARYARPPLKPLPQPAAPNHRIHIDLFGPLAASDSGKKYVLVITDSFSKYVELVAIRSKEAKCVADALMDTWFTRYSTPHEVVSDNGKEFCNKLSEELYDRLKILHRTTSPYHPECNASAEVFNRTMRQYLQSVMKPPYLDWEIYLPALRIAYNTSISKATKKSPFSLVFGMDPQMPFFDFEPKINYSDDYDDRLVALEKARQEAIENNLVYKEMYAAQYNARHKVKEPSLAVGDLILVEQPPNPKYKNAKLQPAYDGPFPIVRLSVPNVYYQKGRKTHVTHINRIKQVRGHISTDLVNGDPAVASKPSKPSQVLRSSADGSLVMEATDHRYVSSQLGLSDTPAPPRGTHVTRRVQPRTFDEPGSDTLLLLDEPLEDEEVLALESEECHESALLEDDLVSSLGRLSIEPEVCMETADQSHFYANDISMQSSFPDSSVRREPPVPSHSYSKRSRTPEVSPPPAAKRTQSSSSRKSLVDVCFAPFRMTRSKGPASEVPAINFPVESKAYGKRLEQLQRSPTPPPDDDVCTPSAAPPSRTPPATPPPP